jgi:hypothetical protein
VRLLSLLTLLPQIAFGAAVIDASGQPITADEATTAAAIVGSDQGEPVVLELPDAAWLMAGGTIGPAHAGTQMVLSEQLTLAQSKMANLETAEAMALLRKAVSSLPSASAAVDPADLAAALELLGQAAQDEGQDDVARAAYTQLLASRPAFRLSTPPGTGYEEVFDAVRREVNALPRSTLAIRHARKEVRWDGAAIDARWTGSEPTTPGRHLLQWSDGLGWQGAWVDVASDGAGVVLLATDGSIEELLAAGAIDEGHRAALVGWLGSMGHDAVVVLQGRDPLRGYHVRGDQVLAWSASAGQSVAASASDLDVVRIALGGGYGLVDGSSYGELLASLDLRLVGPLSLHIDGGVGVSEPLDFGPDHDLTGRVALLPGVGAGVVVRLPRGPVQPFAGLSLGVWIVPTEQRAVAESEAARLDDELSSHLSSRTPVGFRGYLDGGVDLLPAGPLLIRLQAGIGYGFGLQVRAGAQVGLRFGGGA